MPPISRQQSPGEVRQNQPVRRLSWGCRFVAAMECADRASHLNHNVSWILLAGLDRHTAVSNVKSRRLGALEPVSASDSRLQRTRRQRNLVALIKTAESRQYGCRRSDHSPCRTPHCNLKVRFRCRFAADSAAAELPADLLLQLAVTWGTGRALMAKFGS
jgi:hypothetical protein